VVLGFDLRVYGFGRGTTNLSLRTLYPPDLAQVYPTSTCYATILSGVSEWNGVGAGPCDSRCVLLNSPIDSVPLGGNDRVLQHAVQG
jgi:hypothetical protein